MAKMEIATFSELLNRAAQGPEWFWSAVVKDLNLEFFTPYSQIMDTSRGWEWATWFKGASYNYVHDALDKRARGADKDNPAIIFEGEEGVVQTLTYAQLHVEVCRFANALKACGIAQGDRVGLFMPFTPEVAIAMLACGKIGAVFIPIFSGYAAPSVASRLNDCGAKVLVTSDGFTRRGKAVAMKEVADQAADAAPALEKVIVHRRLGREVPWTKGRDVWWHDAVADQPAECETIHTDAEQLYMIIHLRHDRQAKGRSARALWFPNQGRSGPCTLLRPPARRYFVLVYGYWLDDGPLGNQRGVDAWRNALHVRWNARLS
jgi:acetyl-CoA synthetase